jgi:hypothetical protein
MQDINEISDNDIERNSMASWRLPFSPNSYLEGIDASTTSMVTVLVQESSPLVSIPSPHVFFAGSSSKSPVSARIPKLTSA